MTSRTLLALSFSFAAACSFPTPDYRHTTFRCTEGQVCPDDFECHEGACVFSSTVARRGASPADANGHVGSDLDAGSDEQIQSGPDAEAGDAGMLVCRGCDAEVSPACLTEPAHDAGSDSQQDCFDACPEDPDKLAPGICGCGLSDQDSDGDGVSDCQDACPADREKTTAGLCGCGIADVDTDGDGAPDCQDACPADREKTTAGLCGCGIADVDTDGDGAPNCQDACPADREKTTAGLCGCGIADVDTDGDGVRDCRDGCPSDAGKADPGACGCGVAEQCGPYVVEVRNRGGGFVGGFASTYTLTSSFDSQGAHKLIVTVSAERDRNESASIKSVTYGGIAMVEAIQAQHQPIQPTQAPLGVYYLDDPPAAGAITVTFSGRMNGVQGGWLAVDGLASGVALSRQNVAGTTIQLDQPGLRVAAVHTDEGASLSANAPLTQLFSHGGGYICGSAGYVMATQPDAATYKFSGGGPSPVSVGAVFSPVCRPVCVSSGG